MNIKNSYTQKNAAKKKLFLVCSVMLLAVFGCNTHTAAEATPSPAPVPGINKLRFNDAVTGQRFRGLDGYIQGMVDKTWRSTSYEMIGGFYESKWCTGSGARQDCQITGSTNDNHDQHAIYLFTMDYPSDFPQVYGLGLQALWVPKQAGWGAYFSFTESGGNASGEGWGWEVSFKKYSDANDTPQTALTLGDSFSYPIYQTSINYSSGLTPRKDLGLYLANPEAMCERGLTQIQAMAKKVNDDISAHQVQTCDEQPYVGGGIAPLCKPRPMTTDEETAELARAATYFADQEQLLKDHYQEMYAAWMSAFPLNQYWP